MINNKIVNRGRT